MPLREVSIDAVGPDRLRSLIGDRRAAEFAALQLEAREVLAGRIVWNINSTATGGGVAELLQVLLSYARGAGIDTRWLVIDGNAPFFAATKRLHNRLHGARGDGGDLGPAERRGYEEVMDDNGRRLADHVRPGDVVVLHDPQTAGLAARLRDAGAIVVWRCHVGSDVADATTDEAWAFLRPYLDAPHAFVFSRRQYVPGFLPDGKPLAVIPPSIDPFSPKNRDLDTTTCRAVLQQAGLVSGSGLNGGAPPSFVRRDGTQGEVRLVADVVEEGGPAPVDAPLLVQVSRWDRLKDMPGVMSAFAEHVAPVRGCADAHLVLAGPGVKGVTDDPEGAEVLEECTDVWHALPPDVRARVHLASVPMDDVEENAVVINALQRHAAIVAQKSLVEGFGLTVSEAMWKARPVVASAIGGILDQVADGETGVLVHDPTDGAEFGAAVTRLLGDLDEARRMGEAGRQRVIDRFLGDRHLTQYFELLAPLLDA